MARPRGGRIGGGDLSRPGAPWLLLSGLLGLVAIGWGMKPQSVTVNNYSQPENAVVIPWARNLPPLTIHVAPGTPAEVVEAEAQSFRTRIESPALFVSDCEDDPFFGTVQQRQESLSHRPLSVRDRAIQPRTLPITPAETSAAR